MSVIKAQCIFQYASGLPKDRVVNTLFFEDDTVDPMTPTQAAAIDTALNTFWTAHTAVYLGPDSLEKYLSPKVDRTKLLTVNLYDYTDPPGERPIRYTNTHGMHAAAGSGLPAEVAVCLSFRGDYGSAVEFGPDPDEAGPLHRPRPRSSRRGRIFIGPLIQGALSGASDPVPTTELWTLMNERAKALRDDAGIALYGLQWVVYSPTHDTTSPVISGWVDEEWDTQERRGHTAIVRHAWA